MKKTTMLMVLLFLFNLMSAQDIVYDSIRGDKSNWRREKFGTNEKLIGIWYENLGIIVRSKVLLAARIWGGLVENVDYKIDSIKYDTVIFEHKTTPPLNLNIYKYYYNDTSFYSFIGLRKAALGSDLFTGQYLFICPIIKGSRINIYEGIGSNRKILFSINANDLNDNSYRDLNVSEQITFQVINGTKIILRAKILNFINNNETPTNEIKIYPNPTSRILNIKFVKNDGVMVRIFNNKPTLIFEEYVGENNKVIDISKFSSGVYILVISDYSDGNIITTKKIIKK